MRREAAEEDEELRIKEENARERARAAHRETMEANRLLQTFKLKEKDREREADEAIIGKKIHPWDE